MIIKKKITETKKKTKNYPELCLELITKEIQNKKQSKTVKTKQTKKQTKFCKSISTVEPRSNGPATNGIPPITDANSWSLQPNFFYFL